jgi:hypothetical protein
MRALESQDGQSARIVQARHNSMQGLDQVRPCHGYGTVHFSKGARVAFWIGLDLWLHQSSGLVEAKRGWPLHRLWDAACANKQPGVRIGAGMSLCCGSGTSHDTPLMAERW